MKKKNVIRSLDLLVTFAEKQKMHMEIRYIQLIRNIPHILEILYLFELFISDR